MRLEAHYWLRWVSHDLTFHTVTGRVDAPWRCGVPPRQLPESVPSTFIYIPCYDNNGNITRYLDSSGATVAQYTYDAFGNTISQL